MVYYQFAGQEFYFSHSIPELASFEIAEQDSGSILQEPIPTSIKRSCHAMGLVGGKQRDVEIWSAPPGLLVKVAEGSDVYIAPGGQAVVRVKYEGDTIGDTLTSLDHDVFLGPALVLALAQRGIWCLHASAARFNNQLIVFLGESGQGKSTLAGYLATSGMPEWRLVGDDILPVSAGTNGVKAWPRFPQLKLSSDAQPGYGLPEQLPLGKICVLVPTNPKEDAELQLVPPGQAVQELLRHTTGTRLFGPDLLTNHIVFCGQAAGQISVYRLNYPHRVDALPVIKESLENLC